VAGAVRIRNQAQFNPLKFLYEIAKDLPIYENTKVLEFMPDNSPGSLKTEADTLNKLSQ
jgi:hypothetical protein